MQIKDFPFKNTPEDSDILLLQQASGSYHKIALSDLKTWLGVTSGSSGGGSTVQSLTLMHFDGADGSVNFIDVKGRSFSILRGNPFLSTQVKKFGASSLKFNGNGGIYTPPSAVLHLGSSDFTVECWLNWYANSNGQYPIHAIYSIASPDSNTNSCRFCLTESPLGFDISINNQYWTAPYNFAKDTWYHVAFVRAANQLKAYVNGVAMFTTMVANWSHINQPVCIGCNERNDYPFNAFLYIDEFRMAKTAIYSADFTPANAAFTS